MVAGVLGLRADSQVAFCVVYAVMVNMVANKAFGGVGDLAVHADVFARMFSEGIVSGTLFGGAPFVFVNAGVIVRVNDCEFALGQRDSSERITIAETAVRKQKR